MPIVNSGFREASSSFGGAALVMPYPGVERKEDVGFYPMGRRNRLGRELPEITHDRMITYSFLAYRINPMAHRLIEMQVNFVLGNGISISSAHPEALAAIAQFWGNSYNNWSQRIHQRCRDLYLYGEWLHWPITNQTTGMTYIRDIQPDVISAAYPAANDHGVVDRIKFKQILDQSGNVENEITAQVITARLDPRTADLTEPDGDMFLFGVNRTSDTMRGIGELFTLIDYIDMYDDILFSRAEKIRNMAHVYYDLTLDGMDKKSMEDFLKNETNLPPRPGTVYAHNTSAILDMKVPDLRADDHVADAALLKSHIVSSAGWPGTWFDDPGSAGRAVGAEMAEPALKTIVNLQAYMELIIRAEIDYALRKMAEAGTFSLDHGKIPEYALSFSRPSARDIQKVGPAFFRFTQGLNTITNTLQVLTPAEAREIIVSQINQLGLSDAPLSMELPVSLPSKLPTPQEIAQQTADAKIAATAQQVAGATKPAVAKESIGNITPLLRSMHLL